LAIQPSDQRRFDLLICDIDGCLSPEKPLPLDIAKLQQIAEHNRLANTQHDRPAITLCTGRPQPFVECLTRLIGNMAVPCVAENGVWLYHADGNVYDLDPSITHEQMEAAHALASWALAEFGSRGLSQQPGKAAAVSLYHEDEAFLKSITSQIEARCEEMGWPFRISMTWHYINCDLHHISKHTGVQRLLDHTGLSPSRVAGVGDTMGDKGIADHVGLFACPANAEASLKAIADYVSPHAEIDGVLDLLDLLGDVSRVEAVLAQ